MELAGESLLALLDRERDFLPTGGYEVAHDLGRWWDAVLRLEEAIGFVIPAELEAASLRNLELLTDNPDGLLMNNPKIPRLRGDAKINPHNFREALLAFGALVRRRRNRWARDKGCRLVETMDKCLREDGRFDFSALKCRPDVPLCEDPFLGETPRDGWFDGTGTSGRSLEALVWFYQATGDPLTLDLAARIAEHHLRHSTNPDGTVRREIIDPEHAGHDHSYLGTLRGLLLFGLLTENHEFVDVVAATYKNGVRGKIVKESGWAPHDLGKTRFRNEYGDPVTDPASTGDAAQLALWLALKAGHAELLDDVERFLRARILPAQLTEEDVRHNPDVQVTPRQLGAWAIYSPTNGGKGCTPDVLAAVVHSLCDIYSNVCTGNEVGIRVNLHFDCEDENIKTLCSRTDGGKVTVVVKRPENVLIRIPRWAPRSSLRLQVNDEETAINCLGNFAWIRKDRLQEHSRIVFSYALPERFTEERMPSGRLYRYSWRGDEIVGCEPRDEPFPFYPPIGG